MTHTPETNALGFPSKLNPAPTVTQLRGQARDLTPRIRRHQDRREFAQADTLAREQQRLRERATAIEAMANEADIVRHERIRDRIRRAVTKFRRAGA